VSYVVGVVLRRVCGLHQHIALYMYTEDVDQLQRTSNFREAKGSGPEQEIELLNQRAKPKKPRKEVGLNLQPRESALAREHDRKVQKPSV
jgi:hypothetical protein